MIKYEFILQVTYNCNLRCKYCFVKKKPKEIPFNILLEVLEDAKRTGIKRINIDGGEPFTYSHIDELLDYLNESKEFKEIVIVTNGTLLKYHIDHIPKRAYVQVSLDGNKKVTDFLRGKDVFDKAVESMRLLRERGIVFGIGMVYNNYTRDQLPYLIKLAHELGAKWIHANYMVGEYGDVRRTSLEEYSSKVLTARAIASFLGIEITRPLSTNSHCFAGTRTFTFTPDLTYTKCPRYPYTVIGKYPELPSDIIKKLKPQYAVRSPCHGGNWELVPAEN